MKNFYEHDIQWSWRMNKINPPLAVSSQALAMKETATFFEYPQNVMSYWYDNGDIYFDEEESAAIEKFIEYNIEKDPSYPDRMADKIYDVAHAIKKLKVQENLYDLV